jgi:ABC-type proline/glycine betaine transport system permease subunit
VVAGSLIVAVIALLLEVAFALLQRWADPVRAAAVPARD